jgi:uncharacterized protein YbjT (DUF2867 family)
VNLGEYLRQSSTEEKAMGTHILITGARGKTGREVVRMLRDSSGVVVRSGSSRPATEDDAVRFDWHDRATWAPAVAGADAVYLMRPDLPDAPTLVADLVALAEDAHIVLLSEQGAEELTPDSWARIVETAVTEHAARWTLLRPSWFHQVLTDRRFYLDGVRSGELRLPSGGQGVAWVDTRDIAAVAVAALRSPDRHAGRAYTLTGPESVPLDVVAAQLSRVVGRQIRAVDPPPEDELDGLGPWERDIIADLYQRVRRGRFGLVTDDVRAVTGRPARDIEAFIREHADVWPGLDSNPTGQKHASPPRA